MSVFSKIKNFLHRHRNKFVVGGVLITSSVLLMRYAQQKLREWQEKEAKEFFERTRKQQHFESTERTCDQTILNLMTTLNEVLAKAVNTEEVVEELRKKPGNKVELWDRLKVCLECKLEVTFCKLHMFLGFGIRACELFDLFNITVGSIVTNTAEHNWGAPVSKSNFCLRRTAAKIFKFGT